MVCPPTIEMSKGATKDLRRIAKNLAGGWSHSLRLLEGGESNLETYPKL